MQKKFVYQVVDFLSETIVSTFLGVNDLYAKKMFDKFLDDLKLSDDDRNSFHLFKVDEVSVPALISDFSDEKINDCSVVSIL